MSDQNCSGCPEQGKCDGDPQTCGMPRPTRGTMKHIIAVGSGKGGVGKSTVSALLASGLAKMGHKAGILDADITGPSIPKLLGIKETPFSVDGRIQPPSSQGLGIKVMSINLVLEDPTKPVVWRGPLIGNVIKQFWDETDWGDTDTLVVDLPPGTADAPLTVMQSIQLDGVVVVTSPQELSGLVVEKMMHMTRMMSVPLIGIIENMSYAVCPHCGEQWKIFGPSHLEDIRKKWLVPSIARLPLDMGVSILGDAGRIEEYEKDDIPGSIARGVMGNLESAVVL
ncbi:MAG: P-loop NTPase [Synergistota bacterium]|nr:P-loop NTPase [Synergistota bacterium]